MSQLLINDYLKQLDLIKKVSRSSRETIVREVFKDLLKAWGKQQGLVFLAEYPLKTATKSNIAVYGALLHELRIRWVTGKLKTKAMILKKRSAKNSRRVTRKTTLSFPMVPPLCCGKTATRCCVAT